MGSKNKFANTFLGLEKEEEVPQEPIQEVEHKEEPVQAVKTREEVKIEPTVVNTTTMVQRPVSLNELIQGKITDLEQTINLENSRSFRKSKEQAKKFSDKYAGVTISLRREIQEILDILNDESVLNKYEIIETIMINGIKNTNFD